MKREEKLFVIRKYVMASNVESALRKERKTKVHEVFVDDEWRKNNKDNLASAIGYQFQGEPD